MYHTCTTLALKELRSKKEILNILSHDTGMKKLLLKAERKMPTFPSFALPFQDKVQYKKETGEGYLKQPINHLLSLV